MSNKTSTNPGTTSASAEAPPAPAAPATDRPQALTNEQLQLIASGGETATVQASAESVPTMAPPGTTAGAAASAVGLTFSGQKITVLWADEANRNSWVHLEAAGWKRLSQVSDSGSTNMTLLSGHAREIGRAPYAGDDSTGAVSFMYVW